MLTSTMKLGFVTSYMFPHLGGIERIAENLFTGYVASGVEVRWVSSRVPASLASREGPRIRVPCMNLAERLLGVPVPLWGFTGWREVDRLVRWADAVHVLECLYVSSAIALAACRRHAKPVVLSQNVGFIRYRLPVLNWIEHVAYATLGRAVLRSASHVVLATPTAEAYVAELCGPLPESSAFPIGIDTDRFRPGTPAERQAARSALGLPPELPAVLFAGRLVEKKGLPLVLEVSRLRPGIRFVVAGDGPLSGLLHHAPANLVWHRTVAADDMPGYYAAADAVLLPSHGEGLPLVVQESLACGVPTVISADEVYATALREHGVCVAAPRTAEAMAGAVDRAVGPEGGPLSAQARAYAVEHWGLETMIRRYIALLQRLIGQRAARAS